MKVEAKVATAVSFAVALVVLVIVLIFSLSKKSSNQIQAKGRQTSNEQTGDGKSGNGHISQAPSASLQAFLDSTPAVVLDQSFLSAPDSNTHAFELSALVLLCKGQDVSIVKLFLSKILYFSSLVLVFGSATWQCVARVGAE
jgi:hypothetical protein